jgi:hypothetical protein
VGFGGGGGAPRPSDGPTDRKAGLWDGRTDGPTDGPTDGGPTDRRTGRARNRRDLRVAPAGMTRGRCDRTGPAGRRVVPVPGGHGGLLSRACEAEGSPAARVRAVCVCGSACSPQPGADRADIVRSRCAFVRASNGLSRGAPSAARVLLAHTNLASRCDLPLRRRHLGAGAIQGL